MATPSPAGGPIDARHAGAPTSQRGARSLTQARCTRAARALKVDVAVAGDNERGARGHVVL
eukprot:7133283-Lingulodinium_polyedra.AAC.1